MDEKLTDSIARQSTVGQLGAGAHQRNAGADDGINSRSRIREIALSRS
jgi:hypothetical protein